MRAKTPLSPSYIYPPPTEPSEQRDNKVALEDKKPKSLPWFIGRQSGQATIHVVPERRNFYEATRRLEMFREAAGSLIHLPINTDTEGGMTLINCAIDRKNNGAHTSNWSTRATREHFRTQAINHAACLSWSQPPLHHPVPGQTCPEQSILQPGTELSHTGLIPGAGRRVVTAQFQKSASPLFVP